VIAPMYDRPPDPVTRVSSPAWRRSVIYAHVSNETNEPTKLEVTTMKLEIMSADLFQVLNDASQFAAPANSGAPVIECVRLETTPNDAQTVNLIGVATDRFVLGVSRVTATGDAGIGALLSTDDVKNVLRIAKTSKRDAGRRVTVEVDTDALVTPHRGRVTFTFTTGETITVTAIEEQFPKFRQLLTPDVGAMARCASGLGVSPGKVAQFARVAAAKYHPMQVFPGIGDNGRLKPVHVRIGDDFYGLIMPVRAPGDTNLFTYETPGWMLT